MALLGGENDTFCFQTFADRKNGPSDKSLTRVWHGSFAQSFADLTGLNEQCAGVFVAVNETDGKSRKKENITRVRTVFADFDKGLPHDLPLSPSIVVETSKGRYQYYWLAVDLSFDAFYRVEESLIRRFRADPNCKDVSRVLRIPGFFHRKGDPFMVRLVESSGIQYTQQELLDAFDIRENNRIQPLANLKKEIEEIPTDDYWTWVGVGMRVHHATAGSDGGLVIWKGWSSSSPKYDEAECDAKWKTFSLSRSAPATQRSFKKLRSDTVQWPEVSDKSAPIGKSQPNIEALLKHEGVTIFKDDFAQTYHVQRRSGGVELIDDNALRGLHMRADVLGLRTPKDYFADAIYVLGDRNKLHPVRTYLDGIVWDGAKRIDNWLSAYAGVDDTEYTRAVGKLFLLAAVRRVTKPGVKFDNLLVLVGPQGCGKSSLARILTGADWFDDNLTIGADPKSVLELTQGRWIIEFAELTGITKREAESVKAMLSRTRDSARMAYGRATTSRQRQFVFIGTTNSAEFLNDETGNRRFWPVKVGKVDLAALSRDRDQIWAEASVEEAIGTSLTLPEALWSAAAGHQISHKVVDPLEERIEDVVGNHVGVLPLEQLYGVIGLGPDRTSQRRSFHRQIIDRVVSRLGWEKSRLRRPSGDRTDERGGDNRQHVYVRDNPDV